MVDFSNNTNIPHQNEKIAQEDGTLSRHWRTYFERQAKLMQQIVAELPGDQEGLAQQIQQLADDVANAGYLTEVSPQNLAADFGVAFLGWASMTDNVIRSSTTIMPADNTKPLISEGDEAFSISYTPKRDDSIVEITAIFSGSAGPGVNATAALFMAGQADCLVATRTTVQGLQTLSAEMPSWGTSSKTFSVRHGPSIAGTSYIGSQIGATPYYDNATLSHMRVVERKSTPIS